MFFEFGKCTFLCDHCLWEQFYYAQAPFCFSEVRIIHLSTIIVKKILELIIFGVFCLASLVHTTFWNVLTVITISIIHPFNWWIIFLHWSVHVCTYFIVLIRTMVVWIKNIPNNLWHLNSWSLVDGSVLGRFGWCGPIGGRMSWGWTFRL